jgi:hypothetical protein
MMNKILEIYFGSLAGFLVAGYIFRAIAKSLQRSGAFGLEAEKLREEDKWCGSKYSVSWPLSSVVRPSGLLDTKLGSGTGRKSRRRGKKGYNQ